MAVFLKKPLNFLKNIYIHRQMIRVMALREIQSRYAGTLMGVFWSVIHPFLMALIYAFVFSVGLKIQSQGQIPFVVLFFCPLVAWNLFADTLINSANAVIANPHLVKKMVFPVEILPVVSLTSSLMIHGISLVVLGGLMGFYGVAFSLYNLQFLYYAFGLALLALGLGWLVAAVNVFHRDLGQILNILLQAWFWLTPIIWSLDMVPEKYRAILKINPLSYIAEGYKSSFLFRQPFWEDFGYGLYFWAFISVVLCIGAVVFIRLKPEFADVL